jgi:dipeptidyl aminopeptidase/acylaminoacyl peptidase
MGYSVPRGILTSLPDEEGENHMARRTVYLPVMIAVAAAVACLGALLAVSQKAEAAFPGKNGRIAYQGSDHVIYTINPDGGGKTKVTEGSDPSFSADGKKIAYTGWDGNDSEIYTIMATGGKPFQVTDNATNDNDPSWSPDGKRITYTHYSDSDLPNEAAAIYKIAADGGREVLVTDNNGTGALLPSWGRRP